MAKASTRSSAAPVAVKMTVAAMTQSACHACPLALNAAIVAAQAIRDVAGQRTCTVIVDAGNDAVEIPPEDIAPPPSSCARIRADCIPGTGKVRGAS